LDELRQILRYVIPGTITLLIVAVWLQIAPQPPFTLKLPDSLTDAAMLIVLASTFGFIAAALTAEFVQRLPGRPLLNIDAPAVLTAAGEALPVPNNNMATAGALLALLLTLADADNTRAAVQRGHSLLDLYNALGNAFSAVVLALTGISAVTLGWAPVAA
jgi:hypothetical protein